MNNFYLIGMMGCGKSTVGRRLAKHTNNKFIDLDKLIEENEKRTITEIFETNGEDFFRDLESSALQTVSVKDNHIISCGGGIALRNENLTLMKNTGKIIYLERKPENILRTLKTNTRPLLKDGHAAFYEIYKSRKNIYETVSDVKIQNNSSIQNTVKKIINTFPNIYRAK